MTEHPDQMTFDEVVDSEHVEGSVELTRWLANGRPILDPKVLLYLEQQRPIEDVPLPFDLFD